MSLSPLSPRCPPPAVAGLVALAAAMALLPSPVLGQAPGPANPGARPDPLLMPQVLVLPRGERELVIDGTLGDWPELPGVRLDDHRQLSGTANGAWHGPNDCSAVAFLLWDRDALYVSCAVKDEWHRALDAETLLLTEIPAADSLVLTFDPERDTRACGPDPGRREDREFWLADEPGRSVVQWDRLRGTARLLAEDTARCVVLHDKEHGITSYEARLPWAEILPVGKSPAAGLVIDLQLVVNDFDETTDRMPQTRLGLTFGVSPIVDPGLLASMMLVPDAAALQGVVPEFPPKPSVAEPPLQPAEYWQQLASELVQLPPAVFRGDGAPAECGGTKRLAVLERLDEQTARYPRVDLLELMHRSHRRMNREVVGITSRGLPAWWMHRLETVSKLAEDAVPAGSVRLFRLPMGGWLCRTPNRGFLIDASGPQIAEYLWGGAEFCLLTQPLDITRRSDQLLVRMFGAEPPRAYFTHIQFHLPVVPMDKMALTELGKTYTQSSGTRVQALGTALSDGRVPWSCSYRVELPGGPSMLVIGPNLAALEVEAKPCDVMILSPRNSDLLAIVARVGPRLVVLDDTFLCQTVPSLQRLSLRDLHSLQQAIRTTPSVLLAPGESWDVAAKAD
jgi:hypothetical protein